jgi:hypothetical protein
VCSALGDCFIIGQSTVYSKDPNTLGLEPDQQSTVDRKLPRDPGPSAFDCRLLTVDC